MDAKKYAHLSVKRRRIERTTDDECKSDALEDLNLLKLIETALRNEDCSKAVAKIFQQKYRESSFTIEKSVPGHSGFRTSFSAVKVIGLPVATDMINHFGHLIQKLSIKIDVDVSKCEPYDANENINLLNAINEHCRESLVEFELHYAGCNTNNAFNQIKGPFNRVEFLRLDVHNMNDQTEHRQLNKIFPNVREIELELNHLKSSSFIDCNLPKLESLRIDDGRIYETNKAVLIDLIKNNPQIKYLSILHPSPEALDYIQKYLPNLQELQINLNSQEEEQTKVNENNEKYIKFLLNYPNIQNLRIGNGVNNAHLLKLIGKFPKLSQALFGFENDVSEDNIVEFVKQSPSLNQLAIFYSNVEKTRAIENGLKTKLGTDFSIKSDVNTPAQELSIERKIPVVNGANHCHSMIYNTVVMILAAFAIRFFNL